MTKMAITLPLHRVGEPAVDLPDLFEQLATPGRRYDITIRRLPGKTHHPRMTVNCKSV